MRRGNHQAEPVVSRISGASGAGARLPPSFSHSWRSALCACFSLWCLRRSRKAETAPPHAANNVAQRASVFMTGSIQWIVLDEGRDATGRAASAGVQYRLKTMLAGLTLVLASPGACKRALVHASNEGASELSIPYSVLLNWRGAFSALGNSELLCSSKSMLLLLCCEAPYGQFTECAVCPDVLLSSVRWRT